MARPKGVSLTQQFDNKILRLINNLLEEKAREKIKQNNTSAEGSQINEENNNTDDPFANTVLARDITITEATRYVVSRDASLARTKRAIIEKSVDRVLIELKSEEEQELGSLLGERKLEEVTNGITETNIKDSNNESVKVSNGNKSTNESTTDNPDSIGEKASKSDNNDNDLTKDETKSNSKKRSKNSGGSANKRLKDKDRSPPSTSLSQLGGIDDVVAQLMELVGMPILHPEIYQATGIEAPHGVLLHGPPGCGKTTLANALAGDLKVPFIAVSAPSIVSGMSGESEKKIRDLFQEAKNLAPCLIFMDEIDAITPKRDGAQREMEKRIVAQLLTCIDELSMEKNNGKPVIIIGATNRPDSIDPALRRAGRFDREICLNVPSETSRIHILKAMTAGLKISGQLDFANLAKRTPGYVGADLKALATAAGVCAIKRIFTTLSFTCSLPSIKVGEFANDKDHMEVDEDVTMSNGQSDDMPATNNNEDNNSINNSATAEDEPSNKSDFALSLWNDETFQKLSTIQKFLKLHPESLTSEQLAPLCITYEDFLTALPTIQPTAKREGFATIPDVSWSNIGALSNIRVELHMAVVQPIKRPELYEKFGITVPGGVLLWGPPGCGKTLLAKAVANESRANFISIKGPELLNKYVGESEKAVRQVFARARASVPCIIFFDELDALVPKRDTTLSESSSRVVNTLLTELDGLNDRKGIFVVGATNRPDMIDPAMLRPGRLDKTLYVELPNQEERLEILRTIIRSNNTPIDSSVDLEKIAEDPRIGFFSGADLAALIREAGVFALRKKFYTNIENLDENVKQDDDNGDDLNVVTAEDFESALGKVRASVSATELRKYHSISRKMDGVTDLN